jgi:acetyl esterase/lipase
LGGIPGHLSVAGWSAGGNLATVVCQRSLAGGGSAAGGPHIVAQLLLCPVTDCDLLTESYVSNGEGYVLTSALMNWFWDSYCDPADRSDPLASPARGQLAGLPPAVVVTAEFDPLRDEGNAYAAALSAAGVPVTHVQARGHTHTSLPMVDVVISGAPVRAEMFAAFRSYLASGPAVVVPR